MVLGLGRGRRVCFDVLGAEERKSSIIIKSVVQMLWGETVPNLVKFIRFSHIVGNSNFQLFNSKLSPIL